MDVELMHALLETCSMEFMLCIVIFNTCASIHRLNVGRIPTMSAGVEGRFSRRSMFHIFTPILL